MSTSKASGTYSGWERWFSWILEHRALAGLLCILVLVGGLWAAPFELGAIDELRSPVSVDALPELGEQQQIVFTAWPGHSPQDIEDQISYPLSSALLGTPGVKSVRSSSSLGFSSVYAIFEDDVDFYWARTQIFERLSSLAPELLPHGVHPQLGPDATALGQVFWYTLQGQDKDGQVTGGWSQQELRTIQDWSVAPALRAVQGVSEVASIGGFVREYQVDVDPVAMRAHHVTLSQIADAVRQSNRDVGARTIELNRVEYVVRGLGKLSGQKDIEDAVIRAADHRPVRIADVAKVVVGPALRRGALDDAGAPAVGGVVVARVFENPLELIARVKAKIELVQASLPKKTLANGQTSQLKIVPFYDRSELIEDTLSTVSDALLQQFFITVLVVLVMLKSMRAASVISLMLPLGVAGTFALMRLWGVSANIMALGGIAIAIGTMVDLGIVFAESMGASVSGQGPEQDQRARLVSAAALVAPAVLTSVLTTIVSFLPVLALDQRELAVFMPLVLTKTFAMGIAFVLALVMVPGAVMLIWKRNAGAPSRMTDAEPPNHRRRWVLVALFGLALSWTWMPLGAQAGGLRNALLVAGIVGLWLGGLGVFEKNYARMLSWCLEHKRRFLALPAALTLVAALVGVGLGPLLGLFGPSVARSELGQAIERTFPGLGRDYLPGFDEGAFLFMPSTMPHASMREALDALSQTDAAIAAIPEVNRVVGKVGRVDSALDPAPLSMIETVITYHPEFRTNEQGETVRVWRDHIRNASDIWDEITKVAKRPGLSGAPKLMPISARVVMLQSGMRAPMGIRVQGMDLDTIHAFSAELEALLKEVPELEASSVFAERVVAKPYLEIVLDRIALGRYGLSIEKVQETIELGLGGKALTELVLGRERYAVRVRYMRETRDSLKALREFTVPVSSTETVPLSAVARIEYVRGPQVIKSEDSLLTSYLTFDRNGVSLVEAVSAAREHLDAKIASGALTVPIGVHYEFAGSYQNQQRSERKMLLLVPLAFCLVLFLLYLQFRRVSTVLMVCSCVAIALSGAVLLVWLYGQPWFLRLDLFGYSLREVFAVKAVNVSVAVWVGCIALIGLATDDGVVMATYLDQSFKTSPSGLNRQQIRDRVLLGARRRLSPCLMTTATTVLALLPVISSKGRGADLMMPMALPCVGGMVLEVVTLFVIPVLYCARKEREAMRSMD